MTSADLKRLLAQKHAEDVFIPECKDGPSGSHFFQLDGWAMAKSWARPTTYGYECKVTRNDFLRDNKWQNYLKYCSDFYFVCPWELIKPEEVAEPAGLLWASKTGTKLWLKRKAARRDVPIPESILRYVIMRLDSKRGVTDREYWKAWLELKAADQEIGHRVSRRLRELVSERITRVQCENERLHKENEALAQARRVLDALEVGVHSWNLEDRIKQAVARLEHNFPPELKDQLLAAHRALAELVRKL